MAKHVTWQNHSVTEGATRGVLWKKVLLEISQNSQGSFRPATLLKRDSSCEVCEIFYRIPLGDCFWICHWDADFHKQPFADVFQNRCS